MKPVSVLLLITAALALAGCPAKDEKGLDFTKTQRESLDRAKAVEKTVDDASRKALEAADKQ
jgi:hypothetical protein